MLDIFRHRCLFPLNSPLSLVKMMLACRWQHTANCWNRHKALHSWLVSMQGLCLLAVRTTG